MRDSFLELPCVASRQNAGAARAAFWVGREGLIEQNALTGDPIKSGGFDPLATVGPGVFLGPIIGDRKQDIGPPVILRIRWRAQTQNGK